MKQLAMIVERIGRGGKGVFIVSLHECEKRRGNGIGSLGEALRGETQSFGKF